MAQRESHQNGIALVQRCEEPAHLNLFLVGILLYGLVMSILCLDYNSVFIDEAFHITMGRQLLAGEPCPGCPSHTGSVTTWPLIAAYGDMWGGLFGARAAAVAIGLLTTLCVYLTARMLIGNRYAIIAAAIFQFSGQALYLMKLATYDMIAAFFLSAAFLLLVASTKVDSRNYRAAAMISGVCFLFLASVTKYLLPVFVPALLLFVLLRHGVRRTLLYAVLPLAALSVAYAAAAPYPPTDITASQIAVVRETSKLPIGTLTDWTFRWVALAYLLAIFGLFHQRRAGTALTLALLSTPIVLLHLVTGTERSVNKNMIFALIFLAPAAALGVDHIAHLFSMRSCSRPVRAFFTFAVVTVFWAYGFYNLQWLERQYPDVSPVIEFFEGEGYDGMTVAMNGWDGVIYEYSLGARYPNADFNHISYFLREGNPHRHIDGAVDFIVCEDLYYGKECPCTDYRDCIEEDFTLLEDFVIRHSWGETDAKIYGRKQP